MNVLNQNLPFLQTLRQLGNLVPQNQSIYLVGGAVRDALLGIITHDFDFVLPDNVTQIGHRIADALEGAFYILDKKREIVRVIHMSPDGTRQLFDFSAQRGSSLGDDLIQRDFTINAMALDLHNPTEIIDPLRGAQDLNRHILKVCSKESFSNDPLRIIRAVRLAITYGLSFSQDTKQLVSASLDGLRNISPERIRDELFRILDEKQVSSALRILDNIGALSIILPEISQLKNVHQSPPHVHDVYNHSIRTTERLSEILEMIFLGSSSEKGDSWAKGYTSLQLGKYRNYLDSYLKKRLNPDRTIRSLLFFAALYHDCGKSIAYKYHEGKRVQNHENRQNGGKIVYKRASNLRLNNSEIDRLVHTILNYMRPLRITKSGMPPSNREIFRFFKDTGTSGIDVCLLSLADVLATYEHTLPQDLWISHVDNIHILFEAWWNKREQIISPPILVSGNEIMENFNIRPGPEIGILLDEIQESQAAGEISNSNEAVEYAKKRLKQLKENWQI